MEGRGKYFLRSLLFWLLLCLQTIVVALLGSASVVIGGGDGVSLFSAFETDPTKLGNVLHEAPWVALRLLQLHTIRRQHTLRSNHLPCQVQIIIPVHRTNTRMGRVNRIWAKPGGRLSSHGQGVR